MTVGLRIVFCRHRNDTVGARAGGLTAQEKVAKFDRLGARWLQTQEMEEKITLVRDHAGERTAETNAPVSQVGC